MKVPFTLYQVLPSWTWIPRDCRLSVNQSPLIVTPPGVARLRDHAPSLTEAATSIGWLKKGSCSVAASEAPVSEFWAIVRLRLWGMIVAPKSVTVPALG